MNLPLLSLVALPFVGSLIAALLPTNARNTAAALAGAVALCCTLQAALYFPEVGAGGVLRQEIAWMPSLGLNLVLRMDGFAWMFAMLVTGIGLLVVALRALLHVAATIRCRASSPSCWPSWARCSASCCPAT